MSKEQHNRDVAAVMDDLGARARAAKPVLARAATAAKNAALQAAAKSLRQNANRILDANAGDLEAGEKNGLSPAMLDRLALSKERLDGIAASLEAIAGLDDPVGTVIAEWERPNGLDIARVRVPLGAIGIIYESRPNVTADAGGLCLKSGNAAILRGGSEAVNSNRAIHACLVEGLIEAGLPEAAIQLVPTQDRDAVGAMLTMTDTLDVIVPRGGRSLTERVSRESRVPVLAHLDGICHTYVDRDASPAMAADIVVNAKMRRTGICGATETLLIDRAGIDHLLRPMIEKLIESGCELRGDDDVRAADSRIKPAAEADWDTEYLDAILAVRAVDGVEGAISHIAAHGSSHTEAIVTDNVETAEKFLRDVDSAIVMHNSSTQFADGGEFGMGAEIGISTGRLHARGPVGVEQLTSYKYVVRGSGQTRP